MGSTGNEGGRGLDFNAIWDRAAKRLSGIDQSMIDQAKKMLEKAKSAQSKKDEEIFLFDFCIFVRGLIFGKQTYASS